MYKAFIKTNNHRPTDHLLLTTFLIIVYRRFHETFKKT